MPLLSEYERGKIFRALIFGRFKIGKTVGAATFPRPNFIQFDRGIASLKHPEVEAKYQFSKKQILYEDFVERNVDKYGVVKSHNAFDDACRYFDEYMKPTGGKWNGKEVSSQMFDTWIVDSGTSLTTVAKNKAIVLLGTPGKFASAKLSKTHEAAQSTGLIVPKEQDFGAERSMVEQFIEMLLGTDKHVLFLCHEREQWEGKGEDAHVAGIVPLLTGQSVEKIPIKFDEVYNMRDKKEGPNLVRYLQTKPDGLRACGSRLGLPDGTPFEYDAIKKALNI